MLDKIIKINFKQNLSVRFVDCIIFFSFPNLFYLYNTSTTIFSGSRTALKIDDFRLYVHTLVKRGVLREEFLRKLFFRKVQILLNIFIYYVFFHISYSLKVMNRYRQLQNPVFQLKIALKIYFRVSGIDSKIMNFSMEELSCT